MHARQKWAKNLLTLAILTTATSSVHAATIITWLGGTGSWQTAANWNLNTIPNSSTPYSVYVDGGRTGTSSVVTSSASETVAALTIDAGDALNITAPLNFSNGSSSLLMCNGNLAVSGTTLQGGSTSISGTGDVTLSSGTLIAETTTINTGARIDGFGIINDYGPLGLLNKGTISGNSPGNWLRFSMNGGTNVGTFVAENGGSISLSGGMYNAGGSISASAYSLASISAAINGGVISAVGTNAVVSLNGATINGARITASNGGVVALPSATFINVLISCPLTLSSAITFAGGMSNNSIFTCSNGTLYISGNTTFSGIGTFALANTYISPFNANATALSVGPGQLVHGYSPDIGGGQILLTNNGTIDADAPGRLISLFTKSLTNNSIMEATKGGTLNLGSASFSNANGSITADGAGSTVIVQSGAMINGGLLSSLNGGTITFNGGTLANLTINGAPISVPTITLSGVITNNTSLFSSSGLGISGATTFTGSGQIILQGGAIQAASGSPDAMLNSTSHSITGYGTCGSTFTYPVWSMTNAGTLLANAPGKLLVWNAPSNTSNVNTGILSAAGGGTLSLSGVTIAAGSTVTADGANSLVQITNCNISNCTIIGGTAGGTVTINGGAISNAIFSGGSALLIGNSLNNVTINNASLTSISTFYITNPQLSGTLISTGNLNSMAGTFTLQSDATISGTGSLALGHFILNPPLNSVRTILTIGAGQTISGDFQTNTNSFVGVAIANHGTIRITGNWALNAGSNSLLPALTSDGTMVISAGAALNITPQLGGWIAQSAGSMTLNGTALQNHHGWLEIDGGSLTGNGTVASLLVNGGILSPGDTLGILTAGNYVQNSSGEFLEDIAGTNPGIDCDQLLITGNPLDNSRGPVTLAGSLSLNLLTSTDLGKTYTLINNQTSSPVTGTFANLPEGSLITANFNGIPQQFTVSYIGGDGNDVTLTAIPEPATLTLLATTPLLLIPRRKKR